MGFNKRAWRPTGKTILVAATNPAPTGVQLLTGSSDSFVADQVRIHNAGTSLVHLASGVDAATAQTNAVAAAAGVPALGIAVPGGAIEVWTVPKNYFWSGFAASGTQNVYLTPGDGL